MSIIEIVGGAIGSAGGLAAIAAWLKTRAHAQARVQVAQIGAGSAEAERVWAELREVKADTKRCAEEREHDRKLAAEEREECAENIATLQQMVIRLHNVGDDTGRFLIDEARQEVRRSKRSIPPPLPRRGDDE